MNKKRFILLNTKKPYQFTYLVTVTDGQATTPKFTFGAGAPTAVVDWGDGTAVSEVTSGTELNHAYTTGGTYKVTLKSKDQETYLTAIDINSDKIISVVTKINSLQNLATCILNTNAAWTQNILDWQLPAKIADLRLAGTSVSGSVSHWVLPASLVTLRINATLLSGSIATWDLLNNMTYFVAGATALTGCPILTNLKSIRHLEVNDTNLIQASVDLYLSRCVAVEANTTYATPTLNLGGNNQAPSAAGLTDKGTLEAASWTVTVGA